ncbi:MAG TPA: hypothetical protein VKI64_07815, partial [Acidimicrobiales bacterium]|nr:hypothetical protein [Acidimicrobiales bacterium]
MKHRRAPRPARLTAAVCALALLAAACGGSPAHRTGTRRGTGGATASGPAAPGGDAGIYAAAVGPGLSPAVQGVPLRVYVPNSLSNSVDVIDPVTYRVVDHFTVGRVPQHVTPSWDLRTLYADNTEGDSLTPIDPRTGKPGTPIPVTDPY